LGIPLTSVQEVLKRTGGITSRQALISLSGGVDATVLGHLGLAGHEHAGLDLEVGVGIKVVESLKTRDGLLEPRSNGVVRALGGELGEPDGLAAADIVGLLKVVEESLTVLNLGVPVDVAEVEVALVTTFLDESREPLTTLHGETTVADGRSTDESLASVRVEELDVSGGGGGRGHVSLATVVGLVEGEDGLGTVLEGLGAVGGEAVDVDGIIGPEGGDEVQAAVKATGLGVPVVTPATVLTAGGEGVGEVDVVVADTTLVREAGRATGRGRSRAGLSLLGGTGSLDLLDLLNLLGSSGLLLSLGSLVGRLGGLGRLGDLDDGGRLSGSGGGSSRSLGLGSGLGGGRSSTAGTEVVVLPRDDLTVDGSNDGVTTLVLVVTVAVAEGKSRLKKSGGGSEDSELVGDHLD
jgi:hypothetical protein